MKMRLFFLLAFHIVASLNYLSSSVYSQERQATPRKLSKQETSHWWHSPFSGASMLLPSTLISDEVVTSLQSRHPQVLLALRSAIPIEEQYFPTLTITTHPQSLPSTTTFAQSVLDDYLNLGMSDAVINRSLLLESSNSQGSLPLVEISYTRGQRPFISTVLGVAAKQGHEIITITDTPDSFLASAPERKEILSSLSLHPSLSKNSLPTRLDSPTEDATATLPLPSKITIILVGTLVVVLLLKIRNR